MLYKMHVHIGKAQRVNSGEPGTHAGPGGAQGPGAPSGPLEFLQIPETRPLPRVLRKLPGFRIFGIFLKPAGKAVSYHAGRGARWILLFLIPYT